MRWALAAALTLVTCGSPEGPADRPVSRLPAEAGPLDALNRRHARLRQRMAQRGYGEEAGLTRSFVLEEHGVAHPLDLAVGKCSTFLALGGGSIRDLRLALYDGEGEEAATDSVEGEGGLVHVCPQGEVGYRPHHLVLRTREGAGAVMVAHFRSEPGAGDGFDGLFEGVLAPRVPFRDVEEHLARSRSALRARGLRPVDEPLLERVTEGSVVRLPVVLEEGRCYAAIGRSGEGLDDIDLFLFDAAGVEVARDLAGDAEPSIEHCPEETGRHTVELRAFEGAGAVGVLVFSGAAEEETEGDEGAVEATLEEGHAGETPHDPALALGVLAAPLQNRGFSAPVFVSRDAAIVPGEVRTHDVVIGPGCALVAGTASHEGMDLDLYLAEESGREVDRDTAVQSTARVRACRSEPTVLRVAVKGYGRDGAYALAVLRAPDAVRTMQALRLEEATAPYRMRAYRERITIDTELEPGGSVRRSLPLEAGRCMAIAAAGDDGVEDVDLFLRDRRVDELVASDSNPAPHAAVSRCAEEAELLDLEVTVDQGRGTVAIRVLEMVDEEAEPLPEGLDAPGRGEPGAEPSEDDRGEGRPTERAPGDADEEPSPPPGAPEPPGGEAEPAEEAAAGPE
ncbi:MAG TPA: hypothetical protein RMH99_16515 [Sandaracinaceae bacterium LLY-WYZ-13_1]|nr:hypothetical protein [Sandaracinaceae bacterium LLY-WYZ-13_1]